VLLHCQIKFGKHFLSAILILLPFICNAAPVFDAVELYINSRDGQFAKGDSIFVHGQLLKDFDEALTLEVIAAGKSIQKTEVKLSCERSLIYSAAWNEPVSVMIRVYPSRDPKNFAAIGYIVAPNEFKPGLEAPSDLQSYWKQQIANMRKYRPEIKTTAVNDKYCEKKGVKCYELEISMPEGNPVRAFVAMPLDARKKSLPIFIWTHAAGVNKAHCLATPKTAANMAKRGAGAIALDINAHGMLNLQPQAYYDSLRHGPLKSYESWEPASRESVYFRTMFLRLVRALDYLATLEEWDGKRVLVMGESQGGGQTAALAGIDKRVSAAVLNVPAINDLGGKLQNRPGGWPSSFSSKADTELGRSVLPYFDGALLVKYSKAKMFYEAGLVDTTCNPACVFASFNNAGSKDKTILSYPYRPHSGLDQRYRKEWEEMVNSKRAEFIDNYLK